MTKLFKSKIFYYFFMIIVGLDVFNSALGLNVKTDFAFNIFIKYFSLLICLAAFISFFIDLKINHGIFKTYIYLKSIIFPTFFLLYMAKEPILYGVHIFPAEKYLMFGFALVLGLVLLLLYNKYKIENQ
ncbi:hypothetical protein SAMN05421664_1479 [Chryseobacterium soldanellicola]|uniref:Uncharacterized protein n=1 Tax=Chryseobacterium soldanellicola TaxID=311333 RepID=A0A1H1ALH6_9FLAO|nr:hypothetical protein [Chryseobacterium soldanellicola]SDQ40510.1 hypothetical protein SAMN05421664_1479 [Chryseobacterium soldanellicola]